MEKDNTIYLPQWVHNFVGVMLVASLMGLAGVVWDMRVTVVRYNERVDHVETFVNEFRRPGVRYTQDGDRAFARVLELEQELHAYRDKTIRVIPAIQQLEKRIAACHDIVQKNKDLWYECKLFQNSVTSELFFLKKIIEEP